MRTNRQLRAGSLVRAMPFCAVALVSLLITAALPASDILLVYGAGKFNRGDHRISSHLLKSGYSVIVRSDKTVSLADAEGKDLIILSDSVNSAILGAMFRDTPVPVLCSEHQQLDDLGMTMPSAGQDYGRAEPQRAIRITDPAHSLAAGLSGVVPVSIPGCAMGWGAPGPEALKVGALGGPAGSAAEGAPKKYVLFAYELGAQMPGLVAPAKRVGLFLPSSAWANLTPKGKQLFDAAVDHAVRASEGGCVPCQTNEHKVTFTNSSGETVYMGIWGTAPKGSGYPPPKDWANWELKDGESKQWCAPYKFNGGIFPRTGCMTTDGKTWIGCDSGDCRGMVCTTGHQPASFFELNVDDPNKKVWYDVSYVDAFTFPLVLDVDNYTGTPNHGATWCWPAGCETLPACPWPARGDGICYGAMREFESRYPDYPTKNYKQHIAVACKCAEVGVCTCGQDCCTGKCGCSPNAGYLPGTKEYGQRAVDPITGQGSSQCIWNDNPPDPLHPEDWTAYAKAIKTICADSYTWQFHDSAGDMSCKNDDNTPLNFTVTVHRR